MMKSIATLVLLTCAAGTLVAQTTLPRTSIYLVPITEEPKTKRVAFGTPVAVPAAGTYNNQPYFASNSKTLFFTAASQNRKADLFWLDIKKNVVNVWDSTATTAEYSPHLTPDGKSLSFVRVEKDDSTQRLYHRPLRGTTADLVVREPLTVGYYAWNTPASLALFILKKPENELVLYDLQRNSYKTLDTNPGRSIVKNQLDGNIYYVKKPTSGRHLLMQYNPANEQPAVFGEMPDGSEDFAIHQGVIYASSGSILLRWDTNSDKWLDVHDFKNTDVKQFYRFAFSPDGKWLAVVSYEGEKP